MSVVHPALLGREAAAVDRKPSWSSDLNAVRLSKCLAVVRTGIPVVGRGRFQELFLPICGCDERQQRA